MAISANADTFARELRTALGGSAPPFDPIWEQLGFDLLVGL